MKFNKILKFNEYLNNLINLTDIELNDALNLNEGLIVSFENNKVCNILKTKFKVETQIDTDGEIIISNIQDYEGLLKYIKLCGWFPASILYSDLEDYVKWKEHENYTDIKSIIIEPNKDIQIETIPNKLFHVSNSIWLHRIQKVGLIPRALSKNSNHPERIYLTNSPQVAIQIKELFEKETKRQHNIWVIDTRNIKLLFSDINLRDYGFYTTQNISPNDLTLIPD